MKIDAPVTKEKVLAAVFRWVDYLAAGDYEHASSVLNENWSTEELQLAIATGGVMEDRPDGRTFKVTRADETRGGLEPEHDVQFISDANDPDVVEPDDPTLVGEVWFDLPLNGEWSDVTATFLLKKADSGVRLELDELRVR